MRKYIGLSLLVMLIFTLLVPCISLSNNNRSIKLSPTAIIEITIGGNITNIGNNPLPVNETDLLVYDYPLNTSSQKVLATTLYVDSKIIDYKIEYDEEGNPKVIGNTSQLDDQVIDVNQTMTSHIVYKVLVNLTARLKEIENLSLENAGEWSDIVVEDKSLIEETGLWNYTNPLVALASKYFRRAYNRSPLDYLLGVLNWVDNNVKYAIRVPARHPWEVIAYREGDCDDKSNLVITLLRSAGIPAYLEIGLVYLDRPIKIANKTNTYYNKVVAGNGLLTYIFMGGGAHGWMVAYIPPWGYIRVDLTFGGTGLDHIRLAAYYGFNGFYPTIVFSTIKKQDYVESSAEFIREVQEKKLKYTIYVVMRELD